MLIILWKKSCLKSIVNEVNSLYWNTIIKCQMSILHKNISFFSPPDDGYSTHSSAKSQNLTRKYQISSQRKVLDLESEVH